MSDAQQHTSHDPFDTKLRDFYDETLYQHKVSFWASVGASVVGFGALLLALIAYFRDPANLSESVVLGVAGVVSQLVAALFFYLHNRSTAQVLAGFEKLVKLQDTRLAIDLVSRMNEKNHDYMFMTIINILMLRNEPSKELSADVVRALRERGSAGNA